MKILTKKQQRKLVNLIAANQIILNTFDATTGIEKFEAFGCFCDNSKEMIMDIGGLKALNEVKGVIFYDTDYRK